MPRTIRIATNASNIEAILQGAESVEGILGISHQPGASLMPPGDILSLTVTNEATRPLLALLKALRISDSGSVEMSEPTSLAVAGKQHEINNESNETVWDEMAFLLRGDTNPSLNYLVAMGMAGAIAAGGLWTDTLHLIVGAMIIAPAFEPLARLPFAMITGARDLISTGVTSVLAGNAVLVLGAALATLLLEIWGTRPAVPLAEQQWMTYWSTPTFAGVLISAFGAVAGAVIIGGQRAVLTTGVMITLALIPSMALVGMGIATADFAIAGQGLLRWLLDALLVITLSAAVFRLKHRYLHGERTLS
ncbi:DUF389 domain-containing protein [Stutzerimonas tarimensis]|uniref:DUF389 domain-containing protein n=1 Tax=Stutzerimonas tarimensis TaxID=1507735 RepID=A0ABV7T800_9GAMM